MMEEYWDEKKDLSDKPNNKTVMCQDSDNMHLLESDYDCHHLQLIQKAMHINIGGWKEELNWYLKDAPTNITKNTDIVRWWAVCWIHASFFLCAQ